MAIGLSEDVTKEMLQVGHICLHPHAVYIITVGHRPFSMQSVDMAAKRSFCADIMADQLLANM